VVLTEQVADAPVPARVHVPPEVKVIVPVGVRGVLGEVSVTVAMHVVGWLMTTGFVHARVVVVGLIAKGTEKLVPPVDDEGFPAWATEMMKRTTTAERIKGTDT
jgi:hypothetical protein